MIEAIASKDAWPRFTEKNKKEKKVVLDFSNPHKQILNMHFIHLLKDKWWSLLEYSKHFSRKTEAGIWSRSNKQLDKKAGAAVLQFLSF